MTRTPCTIRFTPAIRRSIYVTVAAILAVLVTHGLITQADSERWADLAEQVLALTALLYAAWNTDPTTRTGAPAAEQPPPAPPLIP